MVVIILKSSDWGVIKRFGDKFPDVVLRKSFDLFVKKRLRFNDQNGKTYVGNKVVAEYSNKNDVDKSYDREDVVRWEFSGIIYNGASRKMRGFSI